MYNRRGLLNTHIKTKHCCSQNLTLKSVVLFWMRNIYISGQLYELVIEMYRIKVIDIIPS